MIQMGSLPNRVDQILGKAIKKAIANHKIEGLFALISAALTSQHSMRHTTLSEYQVLPEFMVHRLQNTHHLT